MNQLLQTCERQDSLTLGPLTPLANEQCSSFEIEKCLWDVGVLRSYFLKKVQVLFVENYITRFDCLFEFVEYANHAPPLDLAAALAYMCTVKPTCDAIRLVQSFPSFRNLKKKKGGNNDKIRTISLPAAIE